VAGARVGRPSVAEERRRQIVDAFIRLVAERGLERVALDDVAAEAQVKRPALRHFIGSRDALVVATVEELRRRYEATIRGIAGGAPDGERLVHALFSDDWVHGFAAEDLVFDALLHEATRDETGRGEVRRTYDLLLAEIEAALRRSHPGAGIAVVRDVAYAIVCLVEHNTLMQRIGYPSARSAGVRKAALELTARVGTRA
jgi:AcrR family transcriptional regulator